MARQRATAADVAKWMDEKVQRDWLFQKDVVHEIESKFGREFVYPDRRGKLRISKAVLAEFRKRNAKTVVWVKSKQLWRKRQRGDAISREQR